MIDSHQAYEKYCKMVKSLEAYNKKLNIKNFLQSYDQNWMANTFQLQKRFYLGRDTPISTKPFNRISKQVNLNI